MKYKTESRDGVEYITGDGTPYPVICVVPEGKEVPDLSQYEDRKMLVLTYNDVVPATETMSILQVTHAESMEWARRALVELFYADETNYTLADIDEFFRKSQYFRIDVRHNQATSNIPFTEHHKNPELVTIYFMKESSNLAVQALQESLQIHPTFFKIVAVGDIPTGDIVIVNTYPVVSPFTNSPV